MTKWTVELFTGNTYSLIAGDKKVHGEKGFLEQLAREHNALEKVKELANTLNDKRCPLCDNVVEWYGHQDGCILKAILDELANEKP